jgi:outer membrane lipoprotein-sorting protein
MKQWFLLMCLLIIVSLIIILFLCIGTVHAYSIKYGEFSADFVTSDVDKTSTGRIWVKRDRIRQEVSGADGPLVSIYRFDKMVLWTLMPGNNYMEFKNPIDPSLPQKDDFQRVVLGAETINGYPCEVVKYTYRKKADGIYVVWISQKLNYAIKTETLAANQRVIAATECKNIQEEALSDAQFELPAGYRKFLLYKKN